MWVPPGYVECTDPVCDATQMRMDRGHAHLVGSDGWLVNGDRTGSTDHTGVASLGRPRPFGAPDNRISS